MSSKDQTKLKNSITRLSPDNLNIKLDNPVCEAAMDILTTIHKARYHWEWICLTFDTPIDGDECGPIPWKEMAYHPKFTFKWLDARNYTLTDLIEYFREIGYVDDANALKKLLDDESEQQFSHRLNGGYEPTFLMNFSTITLQRFKH